MENGLAEAERLPRRSDAAMRDIYDSAVRIGSRPTRFLERVREHGGVATAHQLPKGDKIQGGLTELFPVGAPIDATVRTCHALDALEGSGKCR